MKYLHSIVVLLSALVFSSSEHENPKNYIYKAVIIDGSSNHFIWPKATAMMKDYLEETGLFEVEIHRLDTVWVGANYWNLDKEVFHRYIDSFSLDDKSYFLTDNPFEKTDFNIDFNRFDLVISNFGAFAPELSDKTKNDLESFIENGGGLVVVHSANNSWGNWTAFNEMIGLGAWGDRDSNSGPYAYYDEDGTLKVDNSPGICGSHGIEHEFQIRTREPDHPIMKGLPSVWLHTKDELYDRMRGPFKNATILATSYSDEIKNTVPWDTIIKGTKRHEPVLMAINYGKGRVFHTVLGHFDYSMECVGFITTFQRGAEWAASGKVTQEVPSDFPSEARISIRKWIPFGND